MNESPTTVEDRIILATIACIDQYGLTGATNRRIAQAAGVNIAAINYYFRHRDVLITRVMDITLRNAFDLSDIAAMPGASAREFCTAIFVHIVEGGLRYPGLTRAHFYGLLVEGHDDPLVAGHLDRFIATLAADLETRGGLPAAGDRQLALVQIFSAVMLAVLAPALIGRSAGIDLYNADSRQAYVSRLVERLL